MKTKLAFLATLILCFIGVAIAQELLDIDAFRNCSTEQLNDAMDILETAAILESTDRIVTQMQERELNLQEGLFEFVVLRQDYYLVARPELPDCAQITLFDAAYADWLVNTIANMSIISLSQADNDYEDWPVFVENMGETSGLLYTRYQLMRTALETAAELE